MLSDADVLPSQARVAVFGGPAPKTGSEKATPLSMSPTAAPQVGDDAKRARLALIRRRAQMMRLHPGGYLRADVPLTPADFERRQIPVWCAMVSGVFRRDDDVGDRTATVCFKLMRMPSVPFVLLSVGRGTAGAVVVSHDGQQFVVLSPLSVTVERQAA